MKTIEDAYSEIGKGALDFAQQRAWDKVVCEAQIYSKMASLAHWLMLDGVRIDQSIGWADSNIKNGEACLYIRNELLKIKGDRIWGLTFTLYPTGKFNIEYDYNRPANYGETDDVISAKDALQDLLNQQPKK